MSEKIEGCESKLKEKILEFLKNKHNLILIAILTLAFIIRIYFFSLTIEQILWWDEADYMCLAKKIGKGILPNISLKELWSPRRPFLMPLIWAIPFLIGLGELTAKFSITILSLIGIVFTYLVGKEMFDKKVGLIAAFCMSIFWLSLFLNTRFLVGLPGTVFWLASIYCLWKGYVKRGNKIYFWLFGVFFGLTIFTKANGVLLIIPLTALFITKDKLKFLKNKNFWVSIGLMILTLVPFIIWLFLNYTNPAQAFTGVGEGRFANLNLGIFASIWTYISYFPEYLGLGFFILFIIGLGMFIHLIYGIDLIFKKDRNDLRKYLFLFLWIMVFILFFGYQGSKIGETLPFQPRYLIYIFPAVFMITGKGLLKVYSLIKKYNKDIAILIILGLILWGGYYQVRLGNIAIKDFQHSRSTVKTAALWIKENSNEDDIILTMSRPHTMYYSERYVKEAANAEEVLKSNARYIITSVYEPTPRWFLEYPKNNKDILMPARTYVSPESVDTDQKVVTLAIYEFKKH